MAVVFLYFFFSLTKRQFLASILTLHVLLYYVYVFVAFQRASRKIGSPIELPSLNKDFTYLLTYLLTYYSAVPSTIGLICIKLFFVVVFFVLLLFLFFLERGRTIE